MSARTKSRKRALDYLYAAELRGEGLGAQLDADLEAGTPPHNPYTVDLVRGVVTHQARIDEVIARYSHEWSLERLPAVDRNALRIGVFEVLLSDEVPDAVAVSEAVALVRSLSTDDSPGFVNGLLGSVMKDKAVLLS